MRPLIVIHGRAVKRIGNRYFAVQIRPPVLADRIHAAQRVSGRYDRILTTHKTARVIKNYR
jgi:hypothetical protein